MILDWILNQKGKKRNSIKDITEITDKMYDLYY